MAPHRNVTLTVAMLRAAYARAVQTRLRTNKQFVPQLHTPSVLALMENVASELDDSRLASLFIDAQFASMPEDWCLVHFKESYPPPQVVFGRGSVKRYRLYVLSGNDTPSS